MKKLADYGIDDHPADDPERVQINWIVAVLDDCDECEDPRVEVTFEENGNPGTGLVGHLSPATARRLRAALATALREIGEDPGAWISPVPRPEHTTTDPGRAAQSAAWVHRHRRSP